MINNSELPLNLKLIKKCLVCQKDYNQAMVQVLDESEFNLLTYATCSGCGANLLTKLAALPQGIIGNAILTDLKSHEVLEFAQGADLSADDVLEIHQVISQSDLLSKIKKII